jgi:hypothetical protein
MKNIQNFSHKTLRKETTYEIYVQMGDNIKMNLKETACKGVDCIEPAQDRVQ